MMSHRILISAVMVLPWAASGIGLSAVDCDILLRGGIVHRGDGEPPEVGDVAIVGDRIAAVGSFAIGRVGQELDCRGLVVCPGFIDLHNHSDSQVIQPATRSAINYVTQGCTTLVTGNCGSGPVNVDEYLGQLDQHGVGVNVAHLLPQGALRLLVVGNQMRRALPHELARMRQLTTQAMVDGAWGMSTGLIYVPSSYADTDELVQIAQVVARYGGIYASHIRNENVELLSAVEEALTIGARAGLPVHISHFKSSGKDSWGLVRVATEMVEKARAAGQRVTADQYPYTASSTSLEATVVPAWARAGGRDQMLRRIDDESDGSRVRQAIADKLVELDQGRRLQIANYSGQPAYAGRRVDEIAQQEQREAMQVVLSILRGGGAGIVNHSIDESDVRFVMARTWVATASDGRAYLPDGSVPHPRSYGTFPRKLGYYAIREAAIPLEQAIRSATGLPANIIGLSDRGYLRPGYHADVTVLDAQTLQDTATFERPHQYARGIVHVFVNGQPALFHGSATGTLAGRPLRHTFGPASQAMTAAQRSQVDALFTKWNKPGVPGCAVGIIKDGSLVYARGFGQANLDYDVPLRPDSVFYLASVSKQFVAACICLLELEDKLSLDDDVRQWIPELPTWETPITLRHLMHHTSGLRDYLELMQLAGRPLANLTSRREVLELVSRQRSLNFVPGDRYSYCNTGYFLLAEVVQRVSGKPLTEFADDAIFRPLGMTRTRFHDDHKRPVRSRVVSYAETDEGFELSYLANWELTGSGGLLSNLQDLTRWVANFDGHTVGGTEFQQLMHCPGTLNDGTTTRYAGGLMLGEYNGLKTAGHSGSFMGFRTVLQRFVDEELAIAILANVDSMDPDALSHQVAEVVLGDAMREQLRRYTGDYESDELDVRWNIAIEDCHLLLRRHGESIRLRSTGVPGEYAYGGTRIQFSVSENSVPEFSLNTPRSSNIRFLRVTPST